MEKTGKHFRDGSLAVQLPIPPPPPAPTCEAAGFRPDSDPAGDRRRQEWFLASSVSLGRLLLYSSSLLQMQLSRKELFKAARNVSSRARRSGLILNTVNQLLSYFKFLLHYTLVSI